MTRIDGFADFASSRGVNVVGSAQEPSSDVWDKHRADYLGKIAEIGVVDAGQARLLINQMHIVFIDGMKAGLAALAEPEGE